MTADENTPRVTAKGIILAVLISLVAGTGLSEALLRVVMPDWREFYSGRFMTGVTVPGHSPVMAGRPGFDGYFSQNNGDFRVRLQLNELGHRNSEPAAAANGQIWTIGDSMTFGWGVERAEMYSEVLEKRLSAPVYNLASPGTDICGYQTMVARMPKDAAPKATVVGLVLENDVRMYDCPAEARESAAQQQNRPDSGSGFSLLAIKQYATQKSALYNFFAVSLKRVAFVQDFLVRLQFLNKPHTVNHRVAPEQLPALAVSTVNEIVRLKSMLPAGAPFLVMVVPTRFEIRDGTPLYKDLRLAVMKELVRRGISAVDPLTAFTAAGFGPTHFKHDGHWSALGHRIAAEAVADNLKKTNFPNR
jgi:hypothetical protein